MPSLSHGALVEVGEASYLAQQVAERLVPVGGRMVEERRLVTALFADVSGFTDLADRLDPEQLVAVIDPIVSMMSEVVGRYDGYVGKYAGDAILAFFGAPVAHEDDAARAVLAARDMLHELPSLVTGVAGVQHLALHIGVNTGRVIAGFFGGEVRMDYSVLGDAVNVAQRLEAAAPGGSVYVGEETWRLTREQFPFDEVGALQLKGKPDPVRAFRLATAVPSGAVPRPLPAVPAAEPVGALLGRAAELGAAVPVLDGLLDGHGAVVAVTGEPGIGKSRLLQEVGRQADKRGVQWVQARCLSYGSVLPYWPFADLVRRLTGLEGGEDSTGVTERLVAPLEAVGLSRAVPFFLALAGAAHGDTDEGLSPEALRRGLHETLAAGLGALCGDGPLAIAIEDAHWADASTLELAHDLARQAAAGQLALFLTARPEGVDAVTAIIAAVPAAHRMEVALGALRPHGVAELVAGMLGSEVPGELVTMLTERTGGNPLFVQEVVHTLRDAGVLVDDGLGWRLRAGWDASSVPETVEKVVGARIDLLPKATATVLQLASVVGRQVRAPLLHAVAADVDDLDDHVEHLVAGGFLDRVGEGDRELIFHHALVLDVAYDRLLQSHRRDLHRRLADAAEAVYGAGDDVIDLLARHLYLGDAGLRAVNCLVRAADRGRRLFANDEAILHLERAAELARRDGEAEHHVPDVLLTLADLYGLTGRYDDAFQCYSEVRTTTGDPRAWRGLAATLRSQGMYGRALDVIADAERAGPVAGDDATALALERAWAQALSGDVPDAVVTLEAALAARAGRKDNLTAQLLVRLSRMQAAQGHHDDAIGAALEAERIFTAVGDQRGIAAALQSLGGTYATAERPADAAAVLRRGLPLAERVGSAEDVAACLLNLGLALLGLGEVDEAIDCDRRSIAMFERVGLQAGRTNGTTNLAEKLLIAGHLDEAADVCDDAVRLARDIENPYLQAEALDTMAAIRRAQGRESDAVACAMEAAALFESLGAAERADRLRAGYPQ